jgi:hypothetical protein
MVWAIPIADARFQKHLTELEEKARKSEKDKRK